MWVLQDLQNAEIFLAGDTFSTGDVLLEIETDKAQMDVEAQDDGKMCKIMVIESRKYAAVSLC